MYAIIETGGEQIRVTAGDVISVEKIAGEDGSEITLEKVLMIEKDGKAVFGRPYLQGAKVKADIMRTTKDEKVLVLKHQPKKATKKIRGHRQYSTTLKVKEIIGG
ncbi:MAG TPA: 50S ribosomal protein L21 [Dissulfurispiraceae bacterium]|nr:50S ribosomal protein L21 [Dissulfurispiraceae bacterium]